MCFQKGAEQGSCFLRTCSGLRRKTVHVAGKVASCCLVGGLSTVEATSTVRQSDGHQLPFTAIAARALICSLKGEPPAAFDKQEGPQQSLQVAVRGGAWAQLLRMLVLRCHCSYCEGPGSRTLPASLQNPRADACSMKTQSCSPPLKRNYLLRILPSVLKPFQLSLLGSGNMHFTHVSGNQLIELGA